MSIKYMYLWMKQGLRRVEFFDGRHDIEKKSAMPILGRFAKIHDKYLSKNKGKKS